jgi:hypothetical protein
MGADHQGVGRASDELTGSRAGPGASLFRPGCSASDEVDLVRHDDEPFAIQTFVAEPAVRRCSLPRFRSRVVNRRAVNPD